MNIWTNPVHEAGLWVFPFFPICCHSTPDCGLKAKGQLYYDLHSSSFSLHMVWTDPLIKHMPICLTHTHITRMIERFCSIFAITFGMISSYCNFFICAFEVVKQIQLPYHRCFVTEPFPNSRRRLSQIQQFRQMFPT